jgi:pyruvate-formate lyase-activating enzyme/SAM-dependent methyltransferase
MKCTYCERVCEISENENGYCRNYRNDQGNLTENYPDAYLNIYPVSSESIPMLHFYPNSVFLLISTIGCNFTCEGCISRFQTTRKGTLQDILNSHTPEEIIALARESACRGITFCLNEPVVSLPTFLRVARAAKNAGLLVGCSSNGYMTPETLQGMIPYLDFVNIGLKGSTDERYRECGAVSAEPVFRNINTLYHAGVALEVSIMYLNGRECEVIGAAERIRTISSAIPFQVMRFMAFHRNLVGIEPTRHDGEELCKDLRRYLDHVYLFNTPATADLDSRCPVCGAIIIHRVFFGPMAARVLSYQTNGACSCGYQFPHLGEIAPIPEGETRILGGYRSTFGIQFIGEILTTLGVSEDAAIDQICNTIIADGYLSNLPNHGGDIDSYLGMIRYIAELADCEERGKSLTDYMQSIVAEVQNRSKGSEKPRVYTALSHPLFPLYAVKFENSLVEVAGGTSLNRELNLKDSTNAEYTVEKLNNLDPEVILLSGHFAIPVADFLKTCQELGIMCQAISQNRVYALNSSYAPGTPRWILGLMEIANNLHPEVFRYSLPEEEERFNSAVQDSVPRCSMNTSKSEIVQFTETYWQEQWKQQRLARLAVPKKKSPHNFWNDKKRLEDNFIKNLDSWRKEAEEKISAMGIQDGARVLEIGAGTGTLAVPLAAHGCDVVAVEPAEAMRDALVMYEKHQQVRPIMVIPKPWEDVEPEELGASFDVVIAHYSLMITDIGDAIRKMQSVCTGQVHLFWFLTQPYTARLNTALWPKVRGVEFPGEPTADGLWQMLYTMGIYANLTVEHGCEPAYFPAIDDAVKDFSKRLDCTTPEQERAVREYCETSLAKTEQGYCVAGQALGAHIWWKTKN